MTTPDIPIAQWLDDEADARQSNSGRLREAAATIRAKDERIGELEKALLNLGGDAYRMAEMARPSIGDKNANMLLQHAQESHTLLASKP
jgi:hypothetical protein